MLAQESDQLKKLLGEQALEIAILRDLIKKKNPHLLTKLKSDSYINQGYAITLVLRLVQIPRSSCYYHKFSKVAEKTVSQGRQAPGYSIQQDGGKVPNAPIMNWIIELIAGDGYAYGYRKLTVALRRDYRLTINKKKVYRLCKVLDILRPQRQILSKYPRKLARNRIITASNQLFETDIKYGYIVGEDRFFFIQSCLDVYDRSVVAFHIGLRCEATDVVRTLQTALFKRQLFEAELKPASRICRQTNFMSRT